jgi:uncharacterized protein YecE (DUF72 family)
MFHNWYAKSPANFSFSVKAPQLITHYKQLKDCKELLTDFYTVCREGLKEKSGPYYFSFLRDLFFLMHYCNALLKTWTLLL